VLPVCVFELTFQSTSWPIQSNVHFKISDGKSAFPLMSVKTALSRPGDKKTGQGR
jgi:hypothetical protein